jgi:AcrR family transcriptional regulator
MPRKERSSERRKELVPVLARAFADLGYRRVSTAQLAERCGVQETILYRLWPSKKRMFIAALEYIYDLARQRWLAAAQTGDGTRAESAAERMLAYEAGHHGEFGHYRMVFAGLSELDDPDIRAALRKMYLQFVAFIAEAIGDAAKRPSGGRRASKGRTAGRRAASLSAEQRAWTLVGLGTVLDIASELKLLSAEARSALLHDVGRLLLEIEE